MQAGSSTGAAGYQDGAGGSALFNAPYAISWARHKATNASVLYVADSGNHAVRQIDLTTGVVSTLWGGPTTVNQITARGIGLFDRVSGAGHREGRQLVDSNGTPWQHKWHRVTLTVGTTNSKSSTTLRVVVSG